MSDIGFSAPLATGAPPMAEGAGQVARNFLALLKPRVMSLVVFTGLVGMMLAPGAIHPVLGGLALFAIAIGAGASGALNMWWDRDIDAVMTRTKDRPIPKGAVSPDEALVFGIILSVLSVMLIGLASNWVAAALLALTIGFYVFIYTMWLKRRTPQNIVIGGAAGAFPPMIGWAVVSGDVSLAGIVLFLIIFMWTPPHFWALSLYRAGDYAAAGVPMLPVVSGAEETRRQILIYSLLLVPVTLLPLVLGFGFWLYGGVALAGGILFLALAWRVRRSMTEAPAKHLFAYSIFYLFGLFASLLAEQLAGIGVA